MSEGYTGQSGHFNQEFLDSITVNPTVSTSQYVTGNRLGAIQHLVGACRIDGGRAILQSLKILDQSLQSAAMKVMFFNALPVVASADRAAIDISDTEMLKCIGIVNITETYDATASNSIVTKFSIGLGLKSLNGNMGDLWALPVIGATATYAATGLFFTYDFLQC